MGLILTNNMNNKKNILTRCHSQHQQRQQMEYGYSYEACKFLGNNYSALNFCLKISKHNIYDTGNRIKVFTSTNFELKIWKPVELLKTLLPTTCIDWQWNAYFQRFTYSNWQLAEKRNSFTTSREGRKPSEDW